MAGIGGQTHGRQRNRPRRTKSAAGERGITPRRRGTREAEGEHRAGFGAPVRWRGEVPPGSMRPAGDRLRESPAPPCGSASGRRHGFARGRRPLARPAPHAPVGEQRGLNGPACAPVRRCVRDRGLYAAPRPTNAGPKHQCHQALWRLLDGRAFNRYGLLSQAGAFDLARSREDTKRPRLTGRQVSCAIVAPWPETAKRRATHRAGSFRSGQSGAVRGGCGGLPAH